MYMWFGNLHFEGAISGEAQLHINELKLSQSAFGRSYVLKGFIKDFKGVNGQKMRHLPFSLYIPKKLQVPLANKDYKVFGKLQKGSFYGYSLKVDREARFIPIPKTFSLAQKRYEIKKRFKNFLKKKIPFKNARLLLVGMSTGDFQDTYLSFTFSRFGLSHLLAISGFHFAVLALFLNFFLKVFPMKVRLISLAALLTAFYFFIGYGPSLQRAWIVALVYIWGSYQERLLTSVNVLSLSMILVLVLNPLMLFNMGFQFSFGITFAILLFYQPILKGLFFLVQKRSQIDTWILNAVALGLAVHLVALPLSLFHFHKFYWIGFVFNLWMPLLVSFFLFGFMGLLIVCPLLNGVANYGFYVLGYVVEKVMQFIFWVPTSFDDCLRVPYFPDWLIINYLFLLMLLGSFTQKKKVELKFKLF